VISRIGNNYFSEKHLPTGRCNGDVERAAWGRNESSRNYLDEIETSKG
jgi:hypothetical protein